MKILKPQASHVSTKKNEAIILSPAQQDALLKTWEKLNLRRYSPHTLRTYKNAISLFFSAFPDMVPVDIAAQQILAYFLRQ